MTILVACARVFLFVCRFLRYILCNARFGLFLRRLLYVCGLPIDCHMCLLGIGFSGVHCLPSPLKRGYFTVRQSRVVCAKEETTRSEHTDHLFFLRSTNDRWLLPNGRGWKRTAATRRLPRHNAALRPPQHTRYHPWPCQRLPMILGAHLSRRRSRKCRRG